MVQLELSLQNRERVASGIRTQRFNHVALGSLIISFRPVALVRLSGSLPFAVL